MGWGIVKALEAKSMSDIVDAMRDLKIVKHSTTSVSIRQMAERLPRHTLVAVLDWVNGESPSIKKARTELMLLGKNSSVEAAKWLIRQRTMHQAGAKAHSKMSVTTSTPRNTIMQSNLCQEIQYVDDWGPASIPKPKPPGSKHYGAKK